ncbi:MAG: AfsR/SARP family transcriptional regulator [Rubrobacter sp.]
MQGLSIDLPAGYYLERDSDILTLRRSDGSVLGAFSARGVAPEAVRRTAEEETLDGRQVAVPSLWVRYFGHFEMLCNGEPIPLGRNGNALTILKYLLANKNRPVSQDHLMGWLWPESNLKKARWSLNSAVHGLRKLLSRCPTLASASYVLLEEGHYRLCPALRVSTDVEEFDALYERGRRLEAAGHEREAAAEYEGAVALYGGDYLVEDLYEDWTMVERERLSNAYVDMLGRLADHYMQSERPQESIGACYRVLEKDRCHEDSHRLLMRCYAGLGLRGRALRQYRLCEEVLEREYGVEPSPETQILYEGLLRDESA